MTSFVAIAADILVAVLLVATIASAATMSKRIAKLKADESAMRATIGDLMVATASAERAITGLRSTLTECDRSLGARLATAERYAADLAAGVEAGETVLTRIAQIVANTGAPRQAAPGASPKAELAPRPDVADPPRPVEAAPEPRQPAVSERLGVAAAAARALTERALSRLEGRVAA